MRFFPLTLLALICSPAVLASELVIGKGEVYTVKTSEQEVHYERLVIADGGMIRFDDDVSYWDMEADHADIGQEVVIDASGMLGTTGVSGMAEKRRAESCRSGQRGRDGESGAQGQDGRDLHIRLKLASLGSLEVFSNGGQGGTGGQGALGQQGGTARTCKPTRGGHGGSGGIGGDGGDGGNVVVTLESLDDKRSALAFSHMVRVRAEGGAGGKGGQPGLGGMGSEGQYVKRKTLSGDKKYVSGGRPGATGQPGEDGKDGVQGRVFVGGAGGEQNFGYHSGELRYRTEGQDENSKEKQEMELLKQQMKLLQERLNKLEKE
jgi:hypothetical protein